MGFGRRIYKSRLVARGAHAVKAVVGQRCVEDMVVEYIGYGLGGQWM